MSRPHRPEPQPELAVIHNELARARYDGEMGIVALRLILMLAEKVGYNDDALLSHRFKVSDYAKKLGLKGKDGDLYARFERVCDGLMKTLVETRHGVGEEERTKFQIMSLAKYCKKRGEIELHFHAEMRPLLLHLREYFSRIPSEVFFQIKSAYAARLYLVCKSWNPADKRNKNPGWTWTVEQLRHWLALKPEEYPRTLHLTGCILKRAKAELDERGDVSFRYVVKKKGRAVQGWDFEPVANRPKQKLRRRLADLPEPPEPTEEERARNLAVLAEFRAQQKGAPVPAEASV